VAGEDLLLISIKVKVVAAKQEKIFGMNPTYKGNENTTGSGNYFENIKHLLLAPMDN